jgi:hypothetical protein
VTRIERQAESDDEVRSNIPPRARPPVRARETRDQGVAAHVTYRSVLALCRGEPRRRARSHGRQDGRPDPRARGPV